METLRCDSEKSGSDGRTCRPWVLPLAALLFQLVPPALLWAISAVAGAEPPRWPASWERPVSLLALGFSAGVSLGLGGAGAYGVLTQTRPPVAWCLIVFCCAPALFGGAVYLHGLLVFLAWV